MPPVIGAAKTAALATGLRKLNPNASQAGRGSYLANWPNIAKLDWWAHKLQPTQLSRKHVFIIVWLVFLSVGRKWPEDDTSLTGLRVGCDYCRVTRRSHWVGCDYCRVTLALQSDSPYVFVQCAVVMCSYVYHYYYYYYGGVMIEGLRHIHVSGYVRKNESGEGLLLMVECAWKNEGVNHEVGMTLL